MAIDPITAVLAGSALSAAGAILGGRIARERLILSGRLRWRRKLPPGFLLLITGGSGVGKSTVAWALARRYNVVSVVGTDLVREAFRQTTAYPTDEHLRQLIHSSSYRAHGSAVVDDSPAFKTKCLTAFVCQSDFLVLPLVRIAHRIRKKRDSAIVEGINILPAEFLKQFPPREYPKVLLVDLYIQDADTHEKRLRRRGERAHEDPERTADYIHNLTTIRYIDAYLHDECERLRSTGVSHPLENSGGLVKAISSIDVKIHERVRYLRAIGAA
jgi:2-phosphoglycerate kinase